MSETEPTFMEQVAKKAKEKQEPQWWKYTEEEVRWPTLAVKMSPEDAEFVKFAARISGSSKSGIVRNIVKGAIASALGKERTKQELIDAYAKLPPGTKREFGRLLWAALTDKDKGALDV